MDFVCIGDVKLYKTDIRDFADDEFHGWYALMDSEKQNRVDRFRFADDKKRTVAGEMLARKAVADRCGTLPENVNFSVSEYGKPYCTDVDVQFSISHCGDIVICAVSDKPVGADIEKIRPINLKTAKEFCSDDELIYLFGHNPDENEFVYSEDECILTRFFKLWTQREAYVKFTGKGLSEDMFSAPCKKTLFCEDGYVIALCCK